MTAALLAKNHMGARSLVRDKATSTPALEFGSVAPPGPAPAARLIAGARVAVRTDAFEFSLVWITPAANRGPPEG